MQLEPLSLKACRKWITNAEEDVTFDLKDAKKYGRTKEKNFKN